jgi:hypothetical protein
MSPNINNAVLTSRIQDPLKRADKRRMAHVARTASLRRTGLHPVRVAVGNGLIAIGEKLLDQPPMPDPGTLRRAA